MRILDIDMDFFMKIVAGNIVEESGIRLTDGASVWCEDKVVDFIEKNLGLSKLNKINGRILTYHKEALYFWEELMDNKKLKRPFEVIHIDSHSDLSYGDTGYAYVYNKVSRFDLNERRNYVRNQQPNSKIKITSGNYLLYAIAFGYISELVYCTNPNRCPRCKEESGRDYNEKILKYQENEFINGISKNYIQICYNKDKEFDKIYSEKDRNAYIEGAICDSEVKFTIINRLDKMQFSDMKFDFINIAQSPEYTPEEADFILDVFKDYIYEI